MYKNILLDLDDTILDFADGQRQAFFSACREFGIDVGEKEYILYDRINKMSWEKYERGDIEKSVMLVSRYKLLLEEIGYLQLVSQAEILNEYYGKKLSEQGQFIDGAKEGLDILSKKYNVYIITNGNVATQNGRIEKAGIRQYVQGVFISDEVGYRKPSIEFFRSVLNTAKLEKTSTVVVGDSPTSDIQGAYRFGLDAIYFNSHKKICSYPYKYEVGSWKELLLLL